MGVPRRSGGFTTTWSVAVVFEIRITLSQRTDSLDASGAWQREKAETSRHRSRPTDSLAHSLKIKLLPLSCALIHAALTMARLYSHSPVLSIITFPCI